jgi:hypothetical protein
MTPTGWIDIVETTHTIKIARKIMTVKAWNDFNVKYFEQPSDRFICNRCQTFWSSIPGDQQIILCIMEKGVNMCICEQCAKEIDQSLIIK